MRYAAKSVLLLLVLTFAHAAWSQAYPTRPIRLLLPQPPGGHVESQNGRLTGLLQERAQEFVARVIPRLPQEALIQGLEAEGVLGRHLQPLLENAVYHGIEPSMAPGTVVIRIFRTGNEVHVLLSNPVTAAGERRQGNRIAVENIRERLQLFFDAEARMRIREHEGRYEVVIRVPYTDTDRRA
jgi:predicted amidohydrolase YtcJ